MRNLLFALCIFTMACNGGGGKTETATKDSAAATPVDPEAGKGLDLVTKSDCFSCHKLTETSIGPAYSAIAAKYRTITQASMDSMVMQIQNGGSGRWGSVPMTPHPNIVRGDAELMVHYIMSIKP